MNPLSQLFALIVEQLPGCVAPGGRSWPAADESDREYAATEYLFRDALNRCDRAATQRFANLFGAAAGAAPAQAKPRSKRVASAVKAPVYIQTQLMSLTAQNEMLRHMEKAVGPRRSERLTPKDK